MTGWLVERAGTLEPRLNFRALNCHPLVYLSCGRMSSPPLWQWQAHFIHDLIFPVCVPRLLYACAHDAVVPYKRPVSSVEFITHTSVLMCSQGWTPALKKTSFACFTFFPRPSVEWFAESSPPLKVRLIETLSPFQNTGAGIKDSNCNFCLHVTSLCEFIFKIKCDAVLYFLSQQNPNQCLTLRLPAAMCLSGQGGRGE